MAITDGIVLCALCGEGLTGCTLCGTAPLYDNTAEIAKKAIQQRDANAELRQQEQAIRKAAEQIR